MASKEFVGGEPVARAAAAWQRVQQQRDSNSAAAKQWKVNTLQFFSMGAGVTKGGLEKAGFAGVSRRDMKLARNLAASGGGMFMYSGSKRGRPRVDEAKITAAFEKASHPTRTTNRQGDTIRALHGPRAVVARELVRDKVCSLASAYRKVPKTIRPATRNTDLCGQCEALLEVRKEGLRLLREIKDKEPGLPADEYPEVAPPSGVGQHAYEEVGRLAIDALRSALGAGYLGETTGAEAAGLVRMSDTFEFHARVASMQRNSYKADIADARKPQKKKTTLRFDFAGNVDLREAREHKAKWREAEKVSVFGITAWSSRLGDNPTYVDVISEELSHSAKHAASQLIFALGELRARGIVRQGDDIALW